MTCWIKQNEMIQKIEDDIEWLRELAVMNLSQVGNLKDNEANILQAIRHQGAVEYLLDLILWINDDAKKCFIVDGKLDNSSINGQEATGVHLDD